VSGRLWALGLVVDGYVAGFALELEHNLGPASFQNHKVLEEWP
jgi:hypothetical protein